MSQFFQVHPEHPQKRLIVRAAELIRQGAVVVYPTDSGYALGCHLRDKDALERIIRIRQLGKAHHFSLMCRNVSELSTYAYVDNQAFRLLKNHTPGAYTFIFKATKEVPKRLMFPKKKTIGIRIPDDTIALALLEELNEPLMSTSLILPNEQQAECEPYAIREQLEHQVDLILDGGYVDPEPTSVLDLSHDTVEVLREGRGSIEPFL